MTSEAWPERDILEIEEQPDSEVESEEQVIRLHLETPEIPVTVLDAGDERRTMGFQVIVSLDGAPLAWEEMKGALLFNQEIVPVLRQIRAQTGNAAVRLHHTPTVDGRMLILTFALTATVEVLAAAQDAFAAAGLPLAAMDREQSHFAPVKLTAGESGIPVQQQDQLPQRLYGVLRFLFGYDREEPAWWDKDVSAAVLAPYLAQAGQEAVERGQVIVPPPELWRPGQPLDGGGRYN